MTTYDQMVKHVADGYLCKKMSQHKLSECDGKIPAKKQFKARIEFSVGNIHAMDIWFEDDNIIVAGTTLMSYLSDLGIAPSDVKKLVEINEV
jgi:hypothetical protein